MIKSRQRRNIYFDYDVADFLKVLAESTSMTMSYLVNMIVRLYIDNSKNDLKAKD